MKFAGMIADQDMSTINCKILKENSEEIYLQGPLGKTDVRIINSYPSKVNAGKIPRKVPKSEKSKFTQKVPPNFSKAAGTAPGASVPCLSTAFRPRSRAASCMERQVFWNMTQDTVAVDTCHCVGYGISAVVLLSLSLIFMGCNVCIAIVQNNRRPQRPLETQLI